MANFREIGERILELPLKPIELWERALERIPLETIDRIGAKIPRGVSVGGSFSMAAGEGLVGLKVIEAIERIPLPYLVEVPLRLAVVSTVVLAEAFTVGVGMRAAWARGSVERNTMVEPIR